MRPSCSFVARFLCGGTLREILYVQGNRPAMNRRKATLAKSALREMSALTQLANSFIVSLRLGDGLGKQILVPFGFCPFVCNMP